MSPIHELDNVPRVLEKSPVNEPADKTEKLEQQPSTFKQQSNLLKTSKAEPLSSSSCITSEFLAEAGLGLTTHNLEESEICNMDERELVNVQKASAPFDQQTDLLPKSLREESTLSVVQDCSPLEESATLVQISPLSSRCCESFTPKLSVKEKMPTTTDVPLLSKENELSTGKNPRIFALQQLQEEHHKNPRVLTLQQLQEEHRKKTGSGKIVSLQELTAITTRCVHTIYVHVLDGYL